MDVCNVCVGVCRAHVCVCVKCLYVKHSINVSLLQLFESMKKTVVGLLAVIIKSMRSVFSSLFMVFFTKNRSWINF